jgi:repressor LexA
LPDITKRQLEVLQVIYSASSERGFPPTLREIGDALGISSTKGTFEHVRALERKGLVARSGSASRSLVVTKPGRAALGLKGTPEGNRADTLSVPIVGRVAAGMPMLAQEHLEDTVQIDQALVGGARDVFALRIRGDSMIGDGIFNGDLVFVRKTSVAKPGQVVIALIDDEATCKRYFPEGDTIRLQPSNPKMGPIRVKKSDFHEPMIQGVVVAVHHQFDG